MFFVCKSGIFNENRDAIADFQKEEKKRLFLAFLTTSIDRSISITLRCEQSTARSCINVAVRKVRALVLLEDTRGETRGKKR
mmetsp:Transcript_45559/g.89736  ORF Transcript_45559/g.89736 Transcript_45559/m.89736 type:complete len:82 (+) Transcript_45559:405-650(+)